MQSKNFMMWDVDTWDWLLSSERAKKAKHHDGHFVMYTDRRIWNLPVAEWSSILLPYITLRSVARKEINILLSWLKRKCHSLYILCTTFLRSSVQLSCRSFIWMIANQLWFFFNKKIIKVRRRGEVWTLNHQLWINVNWCDKWMQY